MIAIEHLIYDGLQVVPDEPLHASQRHCSGIINVFVANDPPERVAGIVGSFGIIGGERLKRGRNRTRHAHTVRAAMELSRTLFSGGPTVCCHESSSAAPH